MLLLLLSAGASSATSRHAVKNSFLRRAIYNISIKYILREWTATPGFMSCRFTYVAHPNLQYLSALLRVASGLSNDRLFYVEIDRSGAV